MVNGKLSMIHDFLVRPEPFDIPAVRPEPVEGNGWLAQDRPVERVNGGFFNSLLRQESIATEV